MKKFLLVLLISLIYINPLTAKPLTPEDFSSGIPLTVTESATIYKFSIPQAMYEDLDRKDFGDIRIFNNNNEPVPHSIKAKVNKKVSQIPAVTLAFFPIIKTSTKDKNNFSLNINTDSNGAIINVQSDGKQQTSSDISYYLIDLSTLKKTPEKLQFKWHTLQENFSVKTTLEQSSNLTDWFTIKTDTTLAALNFSGHVLVKNKIDLNSTKNKYLRLRWPVSNSDAKIIQIQALFADQEQSEPLEWKSIAPISIHPATTPLPDKEENNTLEYKIQGIFPLHSITLDLPVKNTVFKAVLKSRSNKESEWKFRYKGLFYNIDINGTTLTHDKIFSGNNSDTFWQLEFLSDTLQHSSPKPQLKIGWIPHEIYFLNQGQGPFTVAFGNYTIEPAQNLVDQLFSNIDDDQQQTMIKTAHLGDLFSLGEKKIKTKPLPWQKWTLWAVLVSGVFLLGFMAVRLFKQMNI